MRGWIVGMLVGTLLFCGGHMNAATGAEPKVIHTQKTRELVIILRNESGQWTQGKNSFMLEFTSAATNQPADVGKVSLNTAMSMPGMPAMIAGASLTPDKGPGRYVGTISFPDSGARQVTVSWDGPVGKGSSRFSVPVR